MLHRRHSKPGHRNPSCGIRNILTLAARYVWKTVKINLTRTIDTDNSNSDCFYLNRSKIKVQIEVQLDGRSIDTHARCPKHILFPTSIGRISSYPMPFLRATVSSKVHYLRWLKPILAQRRPVKRSLETSFSRQSNATSDPRQVLLGTFWPRGP